MINGWELYFVDTETTGLHIVNCDIIELSFIRFSNGEQKTWCLKPLNYEAIEKAALRINGHKLEDLEWKTAFGKETYKEPSEAIIDIENWIMNDDLPSEKRVFVSYNIAFDKPRLELLWDKVGAADSFPFGRRSLDPMMVEFYLDLAKGELATSYAQKEVAKKYGKSYKGNAHRADVDTLVLSEIFNSQINRLNKIIEYDK